MRLWRMKTTTDEISVPVQASEESSASSASEGSPAPEAPIRVVVLVGSNREGRFGPVIAEWLLEEVRGRDDLAPEVVDVGEIALPMNFARSPEATAALAEVTPKLAAADAFVVLTPEYNHSFPAGLKNLIDWHYTEWCAKPVALVSYGGLSGGLRAGEHLRQVFAELHAVTIRDTVSFHGARATFDEAGRPHDTVAPAAAAKVMLDQLVWWARVLREGRGVRPYGG